MLLYINIYIYIIYLRSEHINIFENNVFQRFMDFLNVSFVSPYRDILYS